MLVFNLLQRVPKHRANAKLLRNGSRQVPPYGTTEQSPVSTSESCPSFLLRGRWNIEVPVIDSGDFVLIDIGVH